MVPPISTGGASVSYAWIVLAVHVWAGSYSFYSRYFGAIVAVPKGFTVRAHRFSEPWRRVQKEGRR